MQVQRFVDDLSGGGDYLALFFFKYTLREIKFPRNLKKLTTCEIKKNSQTVKLNFNEVVFDSIVQFDEKKT